MKAGDDPAPVAGAILYLLAGPLIWAAHLFLVYVPQAELCAFRVTGIAAVDPRWISAGVGAATVLAGAALALVVWRPRSTARLFRAAAFLEGDNGRFMVAVMRLLTVLSLAGVLWAGAAALLLPPCPQLR